MHKILHTKNIFDLTMFWHTTNRVFEIPVLNLRKIKPIYLQLFDKRYSNWLSS